jgi:4-amino-4-deoxy-L-arabinose transferase-like glycosyltransferase
VALLSSRPALPPSSTGVVVLVGSCLFLFVFGLDLVGLVGADEPRYAQVAREMFERGDWVTPTLGGEPWLEKPALYYWEAILAYHAFGVSDWAARLPSGVSAGLMIAAIYAFMRRLRPGTELDAALLTASSAALIGFSRAASTDMPLSANLVISLLCWFTFHESGRRGWLLAASIFLGLATLAKGPVAPGLAALVLVGFALVRRSPRVLSTTLWPPAIATFLLVTGPWFVAVQARNPEFLQVFILEHNLARYGSDLYGHIQPTWYYVPVAALATMSWSVIAAASLGRTVRESWRGIGGPPNDGVNAFLLLCFAIPIAFFSLSQSKLPGYILPAVPPVMLLAAADLQRRHRAGFGARLVTTHCVVAAFAPLALVWQLLTMRAAERVTIGLAMLAVGAALSLVMIAVVGRQASWTRLRAVTLGLTLATFGVLLHSGASLVDETQSARPIADELSAIDANRLPMAVFEASRETEYGLTFYRNRRVSRYERNEVPSGEHLLVLPEESVARLSQILGTRVATRVGAFAAQGVAYYRVAR